MVLFLLMVFICCFFTITTTNLKTISLAGGAAIHIRWATIEKRIGYKVSEWGKLSVIENKNKKECSSQCLKHPQCRGFVRASGTNDDILRECILVDGVPETKTLVFQKDRDFNFYEMNSGCSNKRSLCEHGSRCIPHFNNASFSCAPCYPPYHGTYCNETNEVVPNGPVSQDVLDGKKQSCRALYLNYGASAEISSIHPFNDWRKITVKCYDEFTTFGNIKYGSAPNEATVPTFDTIEDGQDFSILDRYRVTPNYVRMMYELVNFYEISFSCHYWSNYEEFLSKFTSEDSSKAFGYFVGLFDQLPAIDTVCGNYKACSGVAQISYEGANYRVQDKVIKFTNGDYWSAYGPNYACFDTADPAPSYTYSNYLR